MKIKHLKYKEIDFKKYDNCIKNAINHRVYAFSWYLDIVCRNWEVLILNDYQIVMPLPFRRIKKKFLKKMIEQPPFCQQLGVFSLTELSLDKFNLFLDKLETFTINTYNFNSGNTSFLKAKKNYNKRDNFELNLNNSYIDITTKYSKNLKRNIKKAIKNELLITNNVSIKDFLLMKEQNKKHKIKNKQFKKINKLITKIQLRKYGTFYGIKKENDLITIGFFIVSDNRLIHLFSSNTNFGKKVGSVPFLFDTIIQKNESSNVIFDFEGSMIVGVAKFFKSFGSVSNQYVVITKN
ncbi:MAG: hypothetical protein L3J23_02340 [Flavobacteriaceae bacterium]|nr:hypothetical protein [Flavobacteriaceae bacterium]